MNFLYYRPALDFTQVAELNTALKYPMLPQVTYSIQCYAQCRSAARDHMWRMMVSFLKYLLFWRCFLALPSIKVTNVPRSREAEFAAVVSYSPSGVLLRRSGTCKVAIVALIRTHI